MRKATGRRAVPAIGFLSSLHVGCLLETENHCLDDANQPGCPELCLDDPTLAHCDAVDPDQYVQDAGACGTCTVHLPFCDPATTTCVACTEANGCACWRDAPCGADAPVCSNGQCVGCSSDDDCAVFEGMGRTHCHRSTGSCEACEQDCGATVDTKVCEPVSGTCVECTVDTEETACPPAPGEDEGPACDPVAFTCTGAIRGSLGFCQSCISDSECGMAVAYGTYRCVPISFQGAAHGTFCALDLATHRDAIGDAAAPCPDRQPAAVTLTSIGSVEADYCVVRTSLTTCEAVLGISNDACSVDDDCGVPGLSDAICRDSLCTYECVSDRDCPGGSNQPGPDDVCNGIGVTTCDPN